MSFLLTVFLLTSMAAASVAMLRLLGNKYPPEKHSLTEEINQLLPQTQCGQCNYPGCRPYAEAIASKQATINHCPPGGQATIDALAHLLDLPGMTLDADNGEEKPPQVAIIIEDLCIGCTLCIQACPVDAILGAAKYMHTVIVDECTGCELCIPPCPMDCIELQAVEY